MNEKYLSQNFIISKNLNKSVTFFYNQSRYRLLFTLFCDNNGTSNNKTHNFTAFPEIVTQFFLVLDLPQHFF